MSVRISHWWALALGLVLIAIGVFQTARKNAPPAPPAPPGPCQDYAEVSYRPNVKCPPGTRVEVYPAGGGAALVKCVCPPVKK